MSWLDFLPFRKKADAGGYTVVDLMSDVGWSLPTSLSGQRVNLNTALQVSAVYACVRVLSEGVSQVPFKVFKDEGRNKTPAKDHPLYDVLHRKPNGYMSSFALRETMMIHALLAGGAYMAWNATRDQGPGEGFVHGNGRIEAVESVQLRSRVSGYIERIAFAEGQEVKKGQLLFVIDQRPYRAALASAQAQGHGEQVGPIDPVAHVGKR